MSIRRKIVDRLVQWLVDTDPDMYDYDMAWENYFEEEEPEVRTLTTAEIIRNLVYDTGFPNPEEIMQGLGYVAQSPDAVEMSRHDSHDRLDAIEPVMPVLSVLVGALSKITESLLDTKAEELGIAQLRPDSPEMEALKEARRVEAFTTVAAIIAAMIDMDLIHVHREVVGVMQGPADE